MALGSYIQGGSHAYTADSADSLRSQLIGQTLGQFLSGKMIFKRKA
jgi:hypothetical protein